ncbi:hypothetical protein [Nakamurella leprariae]|uniref:Uncharacterized protein n=1 Tax=Nakamurella leprariae TaxID=2803911 RepID=A0A938YI15_9ACTN|nr:hypothetical protein [Nakamurella leprariae]MBM9468213.1 hypothetical protein [Nakamurella leprariae]
MRWEQLFADLESQFERLADADVDAEIAPRARAAFADVELTARLVPAIGTPLRVRTLGPVLTGVLDAVGPDWLTLTESGRRDRLVALGAITSIAGVGRSTAPPMGVVARRWTLRMVLRGLARDRSPVALALAGADPARVDDAAQVGGTIDRVGADFLELATHPEWEPRRAGSVRGTVLVPLAALVAVQISPWG